MCLLILPIKFGLFVFVFSSTKRKRKEIRNTKSHLSSTSETSLGVLGFQSGCIGARALV